MIASGNKNKGVAEWVVREELKRRVEIGLPVMVKEMGTS